MEFKERMQKLRKHLVTLHERMKDEHLPGNSGTRGLTAREYVALAIQEADRLMLDCDEATGTVEVPRTAYSVGEPDRFGATERHESFGVAQLTRPSGGRRLVGAVSSNHPNWITLCISRGRRTVSENLHDEYWMPEGTIVEVDFSIYQWAELITSMNGTCVPCTIDRVFHVSMDPVPNAVKPIFERAISDAKKGVRDLSEAESRFTKQAQELAAEIDSYGLSKKKTEELKSKILKLASDNVHAPRHAATWASQRINEEAEKALTNVKIEAAASLTRIVERAGIKALNSEDGMKFLKGDES